MVLWLLRESSCSSSTPLKKKKKSCVAPPPTPTFKINLSHASWSYFPFKEDSFVLPQLQVISFNTVEIKSWI